MTEFCVAEFNADLESKLDNLDVARAAEITRETCASPTSLVLALMYLDRLRSHNPKYLQSVSSTDLFLVSLMVASKYLYDDGEEDEVFNDEWASSGNLEKKELNRLELEFLSAIDWNLYINPKEFESTTQRLEAAVACKQVAMRQGQWTTYSDINVLSRQLEMIRIWQLLYEYTFKVTAVCAFAYAASVMTMIGTCQIVKSTLNNGKSIKPAEVIDLGTPVDPDIPKEMDLLNDRLRIDPDCWNYDANETMNAEVLRVQENEFCCPETTTTLMLREHVMMSRLTKALFALKIGSFRDLMLGPQVISGWGHV